MTFSPGTGRVTKRVAIHQPEYWPLPRLLAKWASVDLLILLDTVHFDRSSLQHRCRLVSADGLGRWLTIPFVHEDPVPQIRSVEPADGRWATQHWDRVAQWYRGGDKERLNEIKRWYDTMRERDAFSVSQYAADTMHWCAHQIGLTVPTELASALMPPPKGWGNKADLVLHLCQAVGADTFVSGVSGATYLERAGEQFAEAGVKIEVQAFPFAQAFMTESKELSSLHVYLTAGAPVLRALVHGNVISV